jgi:hypothetical protein
VASWTPVERSSSQPAKMQVELVKLSALTCSRRVRIGNVAASPAFDADDPV